MNKVDATADVADDVALGDGTRVWGLAQIREGAILGSDCVVGRGAYIGVAVRIGNCVKIQNFAQVYEPAVLEDGVFVGPAVVLTNDSHPRAVTPDGAPATTAHWQPVGVTIREGASIGARSVCIAPLTVGRWSMVGAGAVVTHDVPDHALVVGSPARQVGWVGRAGRRLVEGPRGTFTCPSTSTTYQVVEGVLTETS